MKNYLFACLLLAAQNVFASDFRNADWGMSIEEVKAGENAKHYGEKQFSSTFQLGYEVKVAGLDAHAMYIFVEDKLVRAGYYFTETHFNDNLYIVDYNNLNEILTKKYGHIKDERKIWHDDLYKNRPQEWGSAISYGHLVMSTKWITSKTRVTLFIQGDNTEIELFIEYISLELERLEKEATEKQTLEDF